MSNTNYKVGSVLQYDSHGEVRTVRVVAKYEDVKNGYPGFGAVYTHQSDNEDGVWGYDYQITRVIKY